MARVLAAYRDPVDPGQLAVCEQLRRLHLTVWYCLYAERLPGFPVNRPSGAAVPLNMQGKTVGFVLARTVGIFGFRLTFSSGLAYPVPMVEAAGVVLLAITAWLQLRQRAAC